MFNSWFADWYRALHRRIPTGQYRQLPGFIECHHGAKFQQLDRECLIHRRACVQPVLKYVFSILSHVPCLTLFYISDLSIVHQYTLIHIFNQCPKIHQSHSRTPV